MIIFINGASSSGKTSLARALQAQWSGPLLYWSLDNVISQLPLHFTGDGVNADEGFPLQAVLAPYRDTLAQIPLLFIGIECDPQELDSRNRKRGDRAAGLSLHQQQTVHFCAGQYDIRLSSTTQSASQLCTAVMDYLSVNAVTTGF